MSMLISSLEDEISRFCSAPQQTNELIYKYLFSKGCEPISVCCSRDTHGSFNVLAEIPSHKLSRISLIEASTDLSEIVSQTLGEPSILPDGAITRLWWSSQAKYSLDGNYTQRAAYGNQLCGDSCDIFGDQAAHSVLLLSDGMGVGGCAAVDSAMITSLLHKLLCAGVSFDASLRLVNAVLLSSNSQERLCTVDACIIDLRSCRLDIYKAGAAPTFIIHNGRVATVETASLPAGILNGAEATHTILSVSDGDIIVMISDGITISGSDWIPSQLMALAELPTDSLCEELLRVAQDRQIDGHCDDMSVIAAKIVLN
jgi:stage II sporulation protein E